MDLADQTMPHMTGVDPARKILEIRPDIPIVLRTSFSDAIYAEKARALGVGRLLTKPFMMEEHAKAVGKFLETINSEE